MSTHTFKSGLLASSALALAFTLGFNASQAQAAGFAIKEQSGSALGNAFAGTTAGANDISYSFFNPATFAKFDGNQASVSASYIAPSFKMVTGTGVGGGNLGGNGGVAALVPAMYGSMDLGDGVKLGIGVNAPFGLATKYNPTWLGRFYAVKSEIHNINVNPTIAYQVNDQLSVAAGVQYSMIEATLTSIKPNAPLQGELITLNGDDQMLGVTAGVLYDLTPETRVGVSYRSNIEHNVDGTATIGAGLSITPVTAKLPLPETVSAGFHHKIDEQWSVMGDVSWTGWSRLKELRVIKKSDGSTYAQDPYDWEDVMFYTLGATYKMDDQLTLRGGVAFDESPIPDSTRSPRMPGADRTWVALGASYKMSDTMTLDGGYTHIFVDDATVDLTSKGTLTGTYENSIDIVSVNLNIKF